jgi:hypothetical protein
MIVAARARERGTAGVLTEGFKWLAVTIAAMAMGEAIALFLGTRPRDGVRNEWATPLHLFLLASDVVSGAAIIWLALAGPDGRVSGPLWGWLILFAVTHASRFGEYLGHRPNPFCANRQLLIVNDIKLLGILAVMLGVVWS